MNVKFKRFLLLIILIQLQSYVEFLKIKNNCAYFFGFILWFPFFAFLLQPSKRKTLDTINYSTKTKKYETDNFGNWRYRFYR